MKSIRKHCNGDDTPRALKQLLQRLLVKDRKERLRDMGDVSILLKDETSAADSAESLMRGATDTGKRWMTYGDGGRRPVDRIGGRRVGKDRGSGPRGPLPSAGETERETSMR